MSGRRARSGQRRLAPRLEVWGQEGWASAAWFGLLGQLLRSLGVLTRRARRPPTEGGGRASGAPFLRGIRWKPSRFARILWEWEQHWSEGGHEQGSEAILGELTRWLRSQAPEGEVGLDPEGKAL